MSFAVKGQTTVVCDVSVIKMVAESSKYGYTVEEKAKIRSHDVEANRVFDLVLRNPKTAGRCYDVGIDFAKDGKSAEFVYDRWDDSIEEKMGKDCIKFQNDCGVGQIYANDPEHNDMSYEQYHERFTYEEEDGSLIYNGYDDSKWGASDEAASN